MSSGRGGASPGARGADLEARCRQLRLALQNQDQFGYASERPSHKASSVAVVQPRKPEEQEETSERIPPTDGTVEVYPPEARPQAAQSVRMLTDEATQIQEVRYCLKTLREQMAARQNNNNNNKHPANGIRVIRLSSRAVGTNGNAEPTEPPLQVTDYQEESVKLREATKRLYAQLAEMETRHREEKEKLQAESSEYRAQLAKQDERLRDAEKRSEERGQQVEELQRLLGGMEVESSVLREKMAAGEAELLQLKEEREEEGAERCAELEKEVAVLKEKIHHLDDMLKCQQRKVRQMIEQLQNSRTVIQERDRVIGDLEEKLAYLEAENREMHDHIQFYLAGQEPPPLTSSENKPEIIYSKPLTPTTPTNKALPFIKVIEIKS